MTCADYLTNSVPDPDRHNVSVLCFKTKRVSRRDPAGSWTGGEVGLMGSRINPGQGRACGVSFMERMGLWTGRALCPMMSLFGFTRHVRVCCVEYLPVDYFHAR
jgi:hypothetical protein